MVVAGHDHPKNAAAFIADKDRAKWHDGALWFVRAKRDRMAQSLPEWETLREKASQIKQHTVARLPDYLEQFTAQAEKRGIRVHFANDAAEHNAIVLGILQSHGVKRVVKSKSMLTEECHLNPFLERHGLDVVDTDLGEWIVQLRHEGPSHIVLPAIHIRKEEVGELFHEKIGTEKGATDPTYLAEAARQRLRDEFLQADAGITGVNFAIAETGGIVVCTNEGNADLGTALPPLHIACMGMEKLIPRASDLSVFLRLLTRSATGQPITAYTSHFHGPRSGGEMHIVIVDNGRSKILASDDFRRSLNCIRCGACKLHRRLPGEDRPAPPVAHLAAGDPHPGASVVDEALSDGRSRMALREPGAVLDDRADREVLPAKPSATAAVQPAQRLGQAARTSSRAEEVVPRTLSRTRKGERGA